MKKFKLLVVMLMVVPLAVLFSACGGTQCDRPHCGDGNCGPLGQCNCGDGCQCNIVPPTDKEFVFSSFNVDGKNYTADKFNGYFAEVIMNAHVPVVAGDVSTLIVPAIWQAFADDEKLAQFIDFDINIVQQGWSATLVDALMGELNLTSYATSAALADCIAGYLFEKHNNSLFFNGVDEDPVAIVFTFSQAEMAACVLGVLNETLGMEIGQFVAKAAKWSALQEAHTAFLDGISKKIIAAFKTSAAFADVWESDGEWLEDGGLVAEAANSAWWNLPIWGALTDRIAMFDEKVADLIAVNIATYIGDLLEIEDEAAFKTFIAGAIGSVKLGAALESALVGLLPKFFSYEPFAGISLSADGVKTIQAVFEYENNWVFPGIRTVIDIEFNYVLTNE